MPATTTPIVATDCVISIDNAAGVLTDISGSSNTASISLEHGLGRARVFGLQWNITRVVGKDASIELKVVYTPTATEGWQLLKNWFFGGTDTPRTVQIDIPDGLPGSDRYTGEFVIENADIPLDAGADELVMCTVSLKPDLAVSTATIGT